MDENTARQDLYRFFRNWQGVPYQNGGMSRRAVDCSGLIVLAYRDVYRLHLPRTAADQANYGSSIPPAELQPGDLIFFKTGMFSEHVGIALDRHSFIHASSSKGVMLSRLDDPYWQNSFWKANRLFAYTNGTSH